MMQHLLEDSKRLSDLILNRNAHIYVCGDAKTMPPSVHKALEEILVMHGLSSSAATEKLNEMATKNRYVRESFS